MDTPEKTSADVRQQLTDALQLDLVGPLPSDNAHIEEILPQAPSKWYLTGFLVPSDAPLADRVDDNEDETLDELNRISSGDDEQEPEAEAASKQSFFPSSMGLSVLVPAELDQLDVSVFWGSYSPYTDLANEDEGSEKGSKLWKPWKRSPREAHMCIDITPKDGPVSIPVPGDDGLHLVVSVRDVADELIVPKKTRSVSVFLVNHRMQAPASQRDVAYAFQTCLKLRSQTTFISRPNVRGKDLDDWDEKVADLQYRHEYEYAVGHNVSAKALLDDDEMSCYEVQTNWIPTADVEKVIPTQFDGVELGMEALSEAESPEQIREMVGGLVERYGKWIQSNRVFVPKDENRKQVAEDLLKRAEIAKDRIEGGLQALDDADVFQAFTMTNRVMARAARQRFSLEREDKDPSKVFAPGWRPFQLAFVLMNLQSVADPTHKEREIVDLLFFPTGGGKTEAYLGLAAFTLVLRRIRNPGIASAGLSVLMRYTLRLLTLDQLGRAATLICALELERQNDIETLGTWPFEIGLWVGQSATPNRIGKKGDKDQYSARRRTIAFQNDDKKNPSPIPLESCPWCGTKFNKNSFELLPNADNPNDLRVRCMNRKCTYGIKAGRRMQKLPLPILSVDEPIYRRLPCFMIATVDKFAALPWVGQTGGFFGKVDCYNEDGFYGPCDPGTGQALKAPLLPPDLIIQDELHLISGPLGTMVGLYETALDALSTHEVNGKPCRPKIVASTATVRRATRQIRALFGRNEVDIFPPPGPNRKDSFFAQTVSREKRNPRTYVGIAAPGRNMKVVLLRTYLAMLGAAQKAWEENGGDKNPNNPADPYMTLLGYFGSLRELGGSRRIVEDEVNSRLMSYDNRRRVDEDKKDAAFAKRKIDYEPVELTSRVSTNRVADAKRRLALPFHEKERVDVALATNMISVGLDITRLGLMVVLGQPKMAAEYIQATSRVGRDDKRPGLVITLLNTYRPRDRSHYERFRAWHTSFYRAVEATSVTPFSPRAVDRGLAAITVALARLGHPGMTAPRGALDITQFRSQLDFVADLIARRAENHDKELEASEAEALRQKIRARTEDLLDTWDKIASEQQRENAGLQYQREVGTAPPLLFQPLDPDLERKPLHARKFKAQRSLRDVEQSVNLWVRNPDGFSVED